MNDTKIEWTDKTWNPLSGCTKVSPGCDHCYAKTMHERFNGPGSFDTVTLHPDRLDQPLRWRKPAKVFVNSMADLFHDDVPDEYIAQVFAVMAIAKKHTFQLLTKRHARMRSLLSSEWMRDQVAAVADLDVMTWPLPNLWLGVSVENQQWADIRIPALLDTPAAVRFISAEPLLGPITFEAELLDWVIIGGESGPGARLMQLDWARAMRYQCELVGTPFLFKQWGEWAPQKTLSTGYLSDPRERHGEIVEDGKYPTIAWHRLYRRVGKKAAGRELDGHLWDEYPAWAVAR